MSWISRFLKLMALAEDPSPKKSWWVHTPFYTSTKPKLFGSVLRLNGLEYDLFKNPDPIIFLFGIKKPWIRPLKLFIIIQAYFYRLELYFFYPYPD